MSDSSFIRLNLQQQVDYRCLLQFDDATPPLLADEPPPLGQNAGPSPVQLLLSAVANCLTDSLLFALRKFKQQAEPLSCRASAEVGRNAEKRLRVLAIEVELQLGTPAEALEYLGRVLDQFEGFCTVSQSVAGAIPIQLRVLDSQGQLLKGPKAGD